MKVKDIKNLVANSDIEIEAFSDIVNINEEEEITKEEVEEILDELDSYELASDHIDAYNEDLLNWYAKDLSRLYKYANESDLFSSNDVVEVLQDGQKIYWEKVINKMREKLYSFLDTWESEDNDED